MNQRRTLIAVVLAALPFALTGPIASAMPATEAATAPAATGASASVATVAGLATNPSGGAVTAASEGSLPPWPPYPYPSSTLVGPFYSLRSCQVARALDPRATSPCFIRLPFPGWLGLPPWYYARA